MKFLQVKVFSNILWHFSISQSGAISSHRQKCANLAHREPRSYTGPFRLSINLLIQIAAGFVAVYYLVPRGSGLVQEEVLSRHSRSLDEVEILSDSNITEIIQLGSDDSSQCYAGNSQQIFDKNVTLQSENINIESAKLIWNNSLSHNLSGLNHNFWPANCFRQWQAINFFLLPDFSVATSQIFTMNF